MSFSSTVTRTNDTTTITVNIQCDLNTQMEWKMNSDGTNGSVKVTDLDNVPEPIKAIELVKSITASERAATTATFPEADKANHVNAIKAMLNEVEQNKGKENKAVIAIKLLDYVSGEALEFTNSHERFKNAVISKCYEFKQVNADMTDVVKKADETLIKLGASTTIPTATTKSAGPVKPTTAPKEDTYTLDLALFTALAKKYNYAPAINSPNTYLSYFESAVRWNRQGVEGSTKAEKMTNYFTWFSDDGQRVKLMKTIFEKHNLIFSDAAMTLYNEWQNTHKPTGNRYIKMNDFATTHKTLFTAL